MYPQSKARLTIRHIVLVDLHSSGHFQLSIVFESMAIRLVTFDALHTIITPRLPIYVQYSQTFEPYLGVLDPDALKRSFKTGTYIVIFAVSSCWPR